MNTADDWGADSRAGVLVIADDHAAKIASMAVEASGARLLGPVAWREAASRLDRQGAVAIVLAETTNADEGTLDRVLPRLEALAAVGTSVIVALAPDQIDRIAAQIAGPRTHLLCAPSMAERAGALALAASAGSFDRMHDVVREGESARLQRLNEEVARIAETLARLTRNDAADGAVDRTQPRTDAVGDRTLRYAPPRSADGATSDIAARDIRDVIRARRLRDQFFGVGLFEDPAWDMLLDLFAAELKRTQVSVSSLCIAAAVAPTTALRWIARMTDAGLFERQPDPFDRRRAFMVLSETASAGMRDYVGATRRAGVPIG